jgi:mRNA-degrading endonuclease RelE of RelBE toxin-antitoxin system
MRSEIKKLSPKEKQKVLEKINNNESNKKIPLFLEAR